MSEVKSFDLALFDDKPFFETAVRYGFSKAIITRAKLEAIEAEAPKGIVQIADAFGSKYLRSEIETARKRIVNLVSLYLIQTSRGDLDIAARLIRDNTFLTLSRNGSGLLKSLFAMPEYPLMGREEKGRIEDFLEFWSLKEKPSDYINALEYRQKNALEIQAGFFFGELMAIGRSQLKEDDVEAASVVRSAIFFHFLSGLETEVHNQVQFAQMLDAWRKKLKAKSKNKLPELNLTGVPEEFHELAQRVTHEIIEHDFPLIRDASLSLDKLVFQLKERYYLCELEIEDTSEYDALVSKEWAKLTKGKTDIDSLLTMFLCIATDLPPKNSLSEKAAKALVKKLRTSNIDEEKTIAWIKQHAPHEKQEGLLEDWAVFMEEAPRYLMDDWDSDYHVAMRFLSENCHIEKPKDKTK